MWWAGITELYLGERAWGIAAPGLTARIEPAADAEEALEALCRALQPPGRRRLRVWLGGAACQPFLLGGLERLHDAAERQRVAAAAAPAHIGWVEACRVWVDRRGGPAGTLVVASREAWMLALCERLGRHGRLVSVRPWWSALLGLPAGPGAEPPLALGVQDCSSLTMLGGGAGGFESATTLAPVLDPETGRAAWARALWIGHGSAPGGPLLRLCTQRPPARGAVGCAFGAWVERAA